MIILANIFLNLAATASSRRRVTTFASSTTLCLCFYGITLLMSTSYALSEQGDTLLKIKSPYTEVGRQMRIAQHHFRRSSWLKSVRSSSFYDWEA